MKLSQTERWILSNQYLILEKLHPDEATGYARIREALEDGFESAYTWELQVCGDDETLSASAGSEVMEVLNMFRQIKTAYDKLDDKSGITEEQVRFSGFDGNHDKQYSFAGWLRDQDKWSELGTESYMNSHGPVLENYRRMLAKWQGAQDKHHLTKDDIIRITT